MTQFLFIVAIIVIAMIKFWNASSKKEHSGGGGENFPFPWEEDNTVEGSSEDSRQVPSQRSEAPYGSSVPPQPSAPPTAQPLAQTLAQRNTEPIIQPNAQPNAQSATQSTTQLHRISNNQATAVETDNKAIEHTEDKELKFNLREAVIYSEILTPKFKDYEV